MYVCFCKEYKKTFGIALKFNKNIPNFREVNAMKCLRTKAKEKKRREKCFTGFKFHIKFIRVKWNRMILPFLLYDVVCCV